MMHSEFENYLRFAPEPVGICKPNDDATEYCAVDLLDETALALEGADEYASRVGDWFVVWIDENGALSRVEWFADRHAALKRFNEQERAWGPDLRALLESAIDKAADDMNLSAGFARWMLAEFESYAEAEDADSMADELERAYCAAGSFSADLIYTSRIIAKLGEHGHDIADLIADYQDNVGGTIEFESFDKLVWLAVEWFKDRVVSNIREA